MENYTGKVTKITEVRHVADEFQKYANPMMGALNEWVTMRVTLDNGLYFFTPMEHLLVQTCGVRGSEQSFASSHASLYYEGTTWWSVGEKQIKTDDIGSITSCIPYAPTIKVGDLIDVRGAIKGNRLSRVKLLGVF